MDNAPSTPGTATPNAADCFECERPSPQTVLDRDGRALCAACVAAYYVACAACSALVPKDDAPDRPEGRVCAGCLEAGAGGPAVPDESRTKALVDEFLELSGRHKEMGRRIDEIKELLKLAAAARERAGNAVVIRGENGAVRCGYSKKVSFADEDALALEPVLGEELFATLFEPKVSVKANSKAILRILEGEEPAPAEIREALRSVIDVVESSMLTART